MNKEKKIKSNVIYFNSEGGKQGEIPNTLEAQSANLIDFFLEVIALAGNGKIIYPRIKTDKKVILQLPPSCDLIEIPNIYNGNIIERIKFIINYPLFLLKPQNRKKIKEATHCVSIGYDFFGSVAAIIRVYILHQNHSYIIRGNRPKTVATSSRSPLNKKFVLLRIKLYDKIMRKMLVKGQADIWFQGQEKYEEYMLKTPIQARKRLHLLNAVLRNLPTIEKSKKRTDLVFLGHINIEKGIIDLLHAFTILKKQGITPTLRVIGSGPDKKIVEDLIQELELVEQITLGGFASSSKEVAIELSLAKIFILPSYTEGLPRAMIESMAIGTPVIASTVGGIPFVIKEGVNGFLVEPKKPKKLAKKIQEVLTIIEDKDTLANITNNAQETAQNFSFKKRAKVFLETSIGHSH